MYKKAGIIVGILIIVVAVAIFIIASAAQNGDKEPVAVKNTAQTAQVQTSAAIETATPITQATAAVTQAPVTIDPVVAPATETTVITTYELSQVPETTSFNAVEFTTSETTQAAPTQVNSQFVELDYNTLPAYVDTTDVGTVVGHKVYAYNGQVIYSLLINTTTNGRLEFFTTRANYELADSTRVNLEIRIYTASSGNFPSIISVHTA